MEAEAIVLSKSLVIDGTYRVQRISFEDRDLLKTMASASILPGDTVRIFRDYDIVIQEIEEILGEELN